MGLIAGTGDLPVVLAGYCRAVGRPIFVLRLSGLAETSLRDFDGVDVGIADLGRGMAALRTAGCVAVCLAGGVPRPDFRALKPDARGLAALAGAVTAAAKGDDALLRFLLAEFEKEGFAVEGPDAVMESLTLPAGALGRHRPSPECLSDIGLALAAAREVGRLDVGQGAVCRDGVILATEVQDGTNAMLERVAAMAAGSPHNASARRGVLAKACKPIQDRRIDLPTIGPVTVRRAAEAGLAGIVGEPGRLLVVDRDTVVALADETGLFVFGAPAAS